MDNLAQFVDELGRIRDSLKELRKQEANILEKFQDLEVGQVIFGNTYELHVGEVIQTELNPEKVRKFLKDDKKFMSIVSITKKDAAKVLLQPDLERLSEVVGVSKRLVTKKR